MPNPIVRPVRTIDNRRDVGNENHFPLVYPLFRDPASVEVKAVSREKLFKWWAILLKHCEPIVHAKRQKMLGDDVSRYHFFDKQGRPIWDIHSIRVAIVTALLEMGVPPSIVQLLVGHQSPIMTLRYHAKDNQKTHDYIKNAWERRRLEAATAIANAGSEEELDDAIGGILGGIVEIGDNEALKFASDCLKNNANLANSEGPFSVFAHGICPGGRCSEGGDKKGGYYQPVHRDRACSRCRFRITGPAFLPGIVMNANVIILELGRSTQKENDLNIQIREARSAGLHLGVLGTRVNQEREFRDELWKDWAAENQSVRQCSELMRGNDNLENLPQVISDVEAHIRTEHNFNLIQSILKDSKLIAGASFDIPDDLEAVRNDMVWDIIENNGDVAKYLLDLPKDQRRIVLDEYANLIENLEHKSTNSNGVIAGLLDGTTQLPDEIFKLDSTVKMEDIP